MSTPSFHKLEFLEVDFVQEHELHLLGTCCPNLTSLIVRDAQRGFYPNGLSIIASSSKNLKYVKIAACVSSWKDLASFENLIELAVTNTKWEGADYGFEYLAQLKLQRLKIVCCLLV